MRRFAYGLALLLAVCGGPARAGVIDTISSWDGVSFNTSFGVPNTATYGQTFTADAALGSQLDSFSFYLHNDNGNSSPTPFAAYVAAWDGTKVSGPILYKSDVRQLPGDPGAPDYTEFTFNTGGVQVTAGSQYVVFLSVSEYYTGNIQARMARSGEVYSGGNFVYYNNANNFGNLTSNEWDYLGGGRGDASFLMTFSDGAPSAVPEPASMSLLVLGAVGMIGYRVRRRKARTETAAV